MAALHRMDAITVLLPEFRDWFPEPLRSRVTVMPNAVRPLPPERIGSRPRRKTVLAVGRLAAVKRHGLLIEAWARLAGEFPDWQLRIFGTGPTAAELEAQVRALGLGGSVHLMGHTEKIVDEYLAAALLAHPAAYEGWGLAVTEALAAGLPVVGFADCPGVNSLVVDGENGLLVPGEGDRTANFAAALAAPHARCDPARRPGAGRSRQRQPVPPGPDRRHVGGRRPRPRCHPDRIRTSHGSLGHGPREPKNPYYLAVRETFLYPLLGTISSYAMLLLTRWSMIMRICLVFSCSSVM